MIFQTLNDIIAYKTGRSLDESESDIDYNQYMINRWLSMYSGNYTFILNETVNKNWQIYSDKKLHYRFLTRILPQGKARKIAYLKKDKGEKSEVSNNIVDKLAKLHELSTKEVREYIESGKVDIKHLKKIYKEESKES